MPYMDDIGNQIDMSDKLKEIFNECKTLKSDQISVPQDVRERMKELCKKIEKIIKDVPNKKFAAAAKVNANDKAVKYYEKLKEGIEKAYSDIYDFMCLKDFYCVSGEGDSKKVKIDVKKYSVNVDKFNEKIQNMVRETVKILDKNPKIKGKVESKKITEKKELSLTVKRLINMGKISEELKNRENATYELHVGSFFNNFCNSEIVEKFRKTSEVLGDLKNKVDNNEREVKKDNTGIILMRNAIAGRLDEIVSSFDMFSEKIDESISFLQDLKTESTALNEERIKCIKELNAEKKNYQKNLLKMDEFKSGALYGETIIKSKYGNLDYASKKGALGANVVVRSCSEFVENLEFILSEIKSGEKIRTISDDARKLNTTLKKLSDDIDSFSNDVGKFNGYFDVNDKASREALSIVQAQYYEVYKSLSNMKLDIDRKEQLDKLEKMQKKLKKEVDDYNKISSKIIRGAKKVLNMTLTMAKYVACVKGYINSIVTFSGDCVKIIGKIEEIQGSEFIKKII